MNLESITQEIKAEIAKLTAALHLLEGDGEKKVKRSPKVKQAKRTMSAAARKKIGAAQRLRWKKIREGKK
jgi:hypothetical protein